MITYKPQHCKGTYDTELGKQSWNFLTNHDNIIRLETASELSKPALEALTNRLIPEFGEPVKNDRIKQMVGHMVRQILEPRGFTLSSSNVKVRFNGLFTRASRYERIN